VELGCSTILYGGHDLQTALTNIAQIGYKAVELCAIGGMAEHLSPDADEATCQKIKDQVAASGLAIESIGASGDIMSPAGRERFTKLIRLAGKLGAPALTTGSGGRSDDEESFKQMVANINELAKVAADNNVKISIKPHVRAAVYDTVTAKRFMQEVDSRWVGLNIDASHLWRTPTQERPEETIPTVAPYVVTARIRDTLSRDIPIGPPETQVPGGGAMNLPAICNVLKRIEQLKYVVLEIVGTKDYDLQKVNDIVKTSFERLAPLLA